ncbi:hypothetical protein [Lacticaseibacillus yichunensis]|uniref:Yip1 domain-containing protein n=1 Tax=Lacticaseibacillus yichunensis TaxID=2486015 RepID=A0ABW4CQV3_9LACO|nr:hypothetical protein [Lacticaseibacillus yichunensis]
MKSKDFLTENRFINYLIATKMYKEMYRSKEGIISILLAVITTGYYCYLSSVISADSLTEALNSLLSYVLGGGFGLLGFLVGGLGILIGSISDEMIEVIDNGGMFQSLLGIVFRFYFDGAILFGVITCCIVDLSLLLLPGSFSLVWFCIAGWITAYCFWYALMLSVMLLGTSIRLMVLRHSILHR